MPDGPVISNPGEGGTVIIGSTVFSGGTEGSVLFLGAGGVVSQDNANFFYDRVTHTLYARGGGGVATNTAYGQNALNSNTTGTRNTCVGVDAGTAIATNSDNVAIGWNALAAEATSNENVAIGSNSLITQNGGMGNTAVGFYSGQGVTSGDNNTFLGWAAGRGITTGNTNIMIGYASNDPGVTTGLYNTLIGSFGAAGFAADMSNTVIIADGQANRCITKDANGNVYTGPPTALATNATNGFLYVPTCAGTPTGAPTAITGHAPVVVDSTNNKLYFYSGGAWRDAGP